MCHLLVHCALWTCALWTCALWTCALWTCALTSCERDWWHWKVCRVEGGGLEGRDWPPPSACRTLCPPPHSSWAVTEGDRHLHSEGRNYWGEPSGQQRRPDIKHHQTPVSHDTVWRWWRIEIDLDWRSIQKYEKLYSPHLLCDVVGMMSLTFCNEVLEYKRRVIRQVSAQANI